MAERITLPLAVPFAEVVPNKGASCKTCDWLSQDQLHCTNKAYIAAHGSDLLGAPAKRWCCVVWEPEGGR